jgi:serine/threonine-protein kinase
MGELVSDRYRLGRWLARTRVGERFAATDVELQRGVTVELASALDDPAARRTWLRDATVSQQLVGEHVLRVLEVGELRTVPFVVREAATRTLADEVTERGAAPIAQAVGWTLDACEAVAEAHAHGIAHGDVRLENVYLVLGVGEPKVKVAWTSAPERGTREGLARDVASLGAMLHDLTSGRTGDDAADEAPTLPDGLAHAVARSFAQETAGGFHGIAELAATLAPYAPPKNAAARNIARILSRAGIVTGTLAPAPLPTPVPAEGAPARSHDRTSFTDEWFGKAPQPTWAEARPRRRTFALVSSALVAVVLGGTWLLWDRGGLPRWTGSAPPEQVGTTEVTSGPWSPEEHAVALSNAAATDPALTPAPAQVEHAEPERTQMEFDDTAPTPVTAVPEPARPAAPEPARPAAAPVPIPQSAPEVTEAPAPETTEPPAPLADPGN